jgi:hypothetical protein
LTHGPETGSLYRLRLDSGVLDMLICLTSSLLVFHLPEHLCSGRLGFSSRKDSVRAKLPLDAGILWARAPIGE